MLFQVDDSKPLSRLHSPFTPF